MTADDPVRWANGLTPSIELENLAGMLAATSDLVFLVSPGGIIQSALIDEASADRPRLTDWSGRPMQDFLTAESIPKFEAALKAVAEDGALRRRVELNHKDGVAPQYPARYSFHKTDAGGSILMLGTDLRPIAEAQEQLVQAQIALERGYEERREHDARYRLLMASAREAFIFVASDGRIADANSAAAGLLDSDADELIGAQFSKEFQDRGKGVQVDTLFSAASTDLAEGVALQAVRSRRELILSPRVFRVGGERILLCRLSHGAGTHGADDRLLRDMEALFQKGPDAIAFCDSAGLITGANARFLDLCGLNGMTEAVSRSLSEFLHRGQVDLSILLDNTQRVGQMKVYATRLVDELGNSTAIEMSAVRLGDRRQSSVGFVARVVESTRAIRSSSQADSLPDTQNRSVHELVGSATLREIVAETGDVIERMCIETAIELTRNNRAAAAEMLGVSRQSLYVKLRKYGLLKREED